MSDDGAWAVVAIALLGNPFSPRYARARRGRGVTRALDFSALNVAVYGPGRKLWALHERPVFDGDRSASAVTIGASRLGWEGDALVVDLDERTSPLAAPLRGRVTFRPSVDSRLAFSLDADGKHTWWPVAPTGRIEVALEEPAVRFSGHGYHDANAGEAPLEESFSRWTWCRSHVDNRTGVSYSVTDRAGGQRGYALDFDTRLGSARTMRPAVSAPLPRTRWGLARESPTEDGVVPRVRRELEDTPFYSRALVETGLGGARVTTMHETLSLERLSRRWVQFLLGFRMRSG